MLTEHNWEALLAIGHQTNERLLSAQLQACQCVPDAQTLERVVLPSTEDGLRAPGLRLGDPRVMALLACLSSFGQLFEGSPTAACARSSPASPPAIAHARRPTTTATCGTRA